MRGFSILINFWNKILKPLIQTLSLNNPVALMLNIGEPFTLFVFKEPVLINFCQKIVDLVIIAQ